MLNEILNSAEVLSKNQQKSIRGGGNCQTCYDNNGGAYNNLDPACEGCGLPEPM